MRRHNSTIVHFEPADSLLDWFFPFRSSLARWGVLALIVSQLALAGVLMQVKPSWEAASKPVSGSGGSAMYQQASAGPARRGSRHQAATSSWRTSHHASRKAAPQRFAVQAWVAPRVMRYDIYPALHARTLPGASCTASVIYSTGAASLSFQGYRQVVGSSGEVHWSWHQMLLHGTGGTGYVRCGWKGRTAQASAGFTVQH